VSRLFALALLLPALAFGQGYPNKPIRLVVPFTPAGAVDIASRATAHELSRILGQSVTVENKPAPAATSACWTWRARHPMATRW